MTNLAKTAGLFVELWNFGKTKLTLAVGLLFVISALNGVGLTLFLPLLNQLLQPNVSQTTMSRPEQWIMEIGRIAGIRCIGPCFAFLAVAAFALEGVCLVAQSKIFHSLLFDYELRLKEAFLESYLKAEWVYLARQDTGKTGALINSQIRAVSESVYYLNYLLNSIIMVVALCAVAAFLSPFLTLIVGLGFLTVVFFLRGRLAKSVRYGGRMVDATGLASARLMEILMYSKAIKAGGLEAGSLKMFGEGAKLLAQAQSNAKVNEDYSRAFLQPAMFLSLLGVLLLGRYVLLLGVAPLFVFLGVGYRLLPPLSYIYNQYQKVVGGLPALDLVKSKIAEAKGQTRAAGRRGGRKIGEIVKIEARSVSFRFGSERPAIRSAGFVLERGEHLCISGPSGSGKSTLVDIVLGLIQPTSGSIEVNGTDFTDLDLAEWRGRVGYMGQDAIIWNDTVYHNLTWGIDRQVERAELFDYMEKAGLSDLLGRGAEGLDAPVGERGAFLSGGQRQRFGLIRVLLKKPGFLLLDEPTSALDEENDRRMLSLVEDYLDATGALLLSVAHRQSWLKHASRIAWMEDGALIDQ